MRSRVDDRLFSSFIEHLGRAIYGGIYDPDDPTADEQGFRTDVIKLVKALQPTLVRYPGGNFVSGYDWTDGIGPRELRPARLDLAWRSIESNVIGIDEFYDWSKKAGTGILAAVNMGTGTPHNAGALLEYCNHPGGTAWSDRRKANGHQEPFNIKTWCLGNEMDGPWQIGQLSAADYGKKARETAKIMKWIDPDIELVLSGSSAPSMPTYPEWDRIVLEHAYDQVEFLSLHRYYEKVGSPEDFLASFWDMDQFIKTVCATADYVKALKRSKKTINLSFDEWNVWYMSQQTPHDWQSAPALLEDRYTLLDALVVGGLGITLLNNADRVKIACLAQLVNVIAPITTVPGRGAFVHSTYYPFRDLSCYGRGTVLVPIVKGQSQETSFGDAPLVPVAAVLDDAGTTITVFALNTDLDHVADLKLDVRSFGSCTLTEWSVLAGTDLTKQNSAEDPAAVKTVQKTIPEQSDWVLHLDPASWNVIRIGIKK
ncbi:intracellular exo-alpha-(1-_5)-L-arabinofuranosidase 1 [Spirochaetia bacterium]|nr:intracellular exo-alpha-(1->5)-L-arabinofuranosidase 1 [Spirochaetia bacterium]